MIAMIEGLVPYAILFVVTAHAIRAGRWSGKVDQRLETIERDIAELKS